MTHEERPAGSLRDAVPEICHHDVVLRPQRGDYRGYGTRKMGLAVAVLPSGVSCPRGSAVCGPEVVCPERERSPQETQQEAPAEVSHACHRVCLGTLCQGVTILMGS